MAPRLRVAEKVDRVLGTRGAERIGEIERGRLRQALDGSGWKLRRIGLHVVRTHRRAAGQRGTSEGQRHADAVRPRVEQRSAIGRHHTRKSDTADGRHKSE